MFPFNNVPVAYHIIHIDISMLVYVWACICMCVSASEAYGAVVRMSRDWWYYFLCYTGVGCIHINRYLFDSLKHTNTDTHKMQTHTHLQTHTDIQKHTHTDTHTSTPLILFTWKSVIPHVPRLCKFTYACMHICHLYKNTKVYWTLYLTVASFALTLFTLYLPLRL